MERRFSDYVVISLKGIAMGAADAVPGVSGGTIALIAGIYEELITTISQVDLSLFTTLRKDGFKSFWTALNGNFLLALFSGILISFVSFMRLAKYLIENEPILIWSFFFGLVIASILFVGKQIEKWSVSVIISMIIGAAFAYYISILPGMSENNGSFFLLFAGALAICAMILPGISGAFILVIIGAYKSLSDSLHDFDFKRIAIFGLGAIIGLLSFSRVLKWLFKHYPNLTLAVLTGFIIGSLNKIWPWKEVLTWRVDEEGIKIPVLEKSISPFSFEGDPQLWLAITLIIVGFLTIVLLEKIGTNKE
ncbi:putative membrane protein [Flavobacteriaceae bacterium MAR_2010_188]|nr:putative membrane protein [Flavobacteriaceae bacterium MAR_2010_188]